MKAIHFYVVNKKKKSLKRRWKGNINMAIKFILTVKGVFQKPFVETTFELF